MAVTLAVIAVLAGCVGGNSSAKIVTVTLPPQKYLVDRIAGGHVEVRSLLSNGANPETYDPTMTNMMNLDRSIAYLRIGNVGFEEAVVGKISQANPSLPIFNISQGVDLITGTHSHGEGTSEEPDPHTWSSVKNARIMATNILEALKTIDPEHTDDYNRNFTDFVAHLDSLDASFTERLSQAGSPAFVVWHPSLSYFARDYGLRQVVAGGAENKENSFAAVRDAIDMAAESDAKVFFYQQDMEQRQLQVVNASIKASEVAINPLSPDWEDELEKIVDALTE